MMMHCSSKITVKLHHRSTISFCIDCKEAHGGPKGLSALLTKIKLGDAPTRKTQDTAKEYYQGTLSTSVLIIMQSMGSGLPKSHG